MLQIVQKLFAPKKNPSSSSYMYQLGEPNWMLRDYHRFADEAYVKNVIAHRAINMISSSSASVPFTIHETSLNGRRKIENHKMLDLLNKPNPVQSSKEFLESVYSYKQISGNAYILALLNQKSKIPIELYALRPDRVTIIPGDNLLPKAYQYKVANNIYEYPVDSLNGNSQILHIKNFNPLSDWYGLSSIEAAAYSIDQHNQAGQWNQALLQNGARPSGAIIVNSKDNGGLTNLTNVQYQELKKDIDQIFSGPRNAGRPILLEGGLDWKEMSLSPKDMDFIESKHSSARDIALALGMPPQLLGIPGDNTYSNLQEARLALWEQTIIPLVENVADNLGNWLASFYGNKIHLSYNLDNISALASKRHEIWNRVQNATFLTINEKRASVGLDPIKGGESFNL